MRKIFIATVLTALPSVLMAQSAIDAYQLSQTDLRGTARFVGMAGAFGALGGDLSTLNQNPAGIGVYRSSEIGATLNIDFMKSSVDGNSVTDTKAYCPNVGYIGAIKTGSDLMPYFQWGVSYGRIASFDRTYEGGYGSLGTSLSNYIAGFSNGYTTETLGQSNTYNPYFESKADWLSILAYNGYIINPDGYLTNSTGDYQLGPDGNRLPKYSGLFREDKLGNPLTTGDAMYHVRERGHVDEYSINFGGNFLNTVYWGLGIGISDIGLTQEIAYDEQLDQARIPASVESGAGSAVGNAYYNLSNYRHVDGTGVNFKLGAIFKPINELRFGIAFHTPTFYSLSDTYDAALDYSFQHPNSSVPDGTAYTDYAYYDWKLRTPWKVMVSAATVLSGRFIFSLDYECDFYNSMTVKNADGYTYEDLKQQIKDYYQPVSTLRVGAEYRITPQFSIRAGVANTWSGVKDDANDGEFEVLTSGTNPAYTFNTQTRYLTLGLGYRINSFYVDAAYVNKYRKSTYHPFTSYGDELGWVYAPITDFTTTNNQIVLSVGVKF